MPGEPKSEAFGCGCSYEKAKTYSFNLQRDGVTLSGQRFDEEGYEVCPEHGIRKYGWASPLISVPPNGDRIDWSKMGSKNKEINLNPKITEDRRDNRDPIKIGMKILSKQNGHS